MKSNIDNKGPFAGLSSATEQAVVQVFAQVVGFNWLEPYTTGEQGETTGSGFFIDDEGHIVTNAHVVNEAKTIWIQIPMFGQRCFFVDLMGFCPEQDMALLKLKDKDREIIESTIGHIPILPLGDSDQLQRTDPVVVLGYPLGQLRIKSSTGVVAGWESGPKGPLVQITSPINHGNSGGPVINSDGQAIGIATLGAAGTLNIGYAIPVNEFKVIIGELYKPGLVRKPSLGILFNFGNKALALALGNPVPPGLYIYNVCHNSLAHKAGIKPGDMLYSFNTLTVDAYGDLSAPWSNDRISIHELISRLQKDSPVSMTIYRKGVKLDISFVFDHSVLYPIRKIYPDFEEVDYETIAGMVIMQLTANHLALLASNAPQLQKYFDHENRSHPALVISHILPGSLAQLSRSLRPGNIITEINGEPVNTLDSFRKAIQKSAENELMTIETADHVLAALELKNIFEYEIALSKHFNYRLSKTLEKLVK